MARVGLVLTFSLLLCACFCTAHFWEMNEVLRIGCRDEVRSMFYHAWDSYMQLAFPRDELLPLSCLGADTFGNYSLTLIDSLDTLLVFGDVIGFAKGVEWLIANVDFNKDVNVSVFETNIRVVGGLLSAHLLAHEFLPDYTSGLLSLALDVGERLLPAFDTPTGLPYGTVNLRYGVPVNETTVTAVASTNTFSLEFGLLSHLTGDARFSEASQRSLDALWSRVGSVVPWDYTYMASRDSTIGTAVDSYYEYLFKAGILFGDKLSLARFSEAYSAVMNHMFKRPWYMSVDMSSGTLTWPAFDALSAFWPGLQVQAGDVSHAGQTLAAFMQIWARFGATPEVFHLMTGQIVPNRSSYPLRPELAESLYYMWMATRDPFWRHAARQIIYSLQNITRVACGYAGIADVHVHRLEDQMNSFFLAETLKYLFLIFEDDSFVNHGAGNYIFNTEGHILPVDWRKHATKSVMLSTPNLASSCTCLKAGFFSSLGAGSFCPLGPEAASIGALQLCSAPPIQDQNHYNATNEAKPTAYRGKIGTGTSNPFQTFKDYIAFRHRNRQAKKKAKN